MHIFDATWIGKAVAVATLAAIFAVLGYPEDSRNAASSRTTLAAWVGGCWKLRRCCVPHRQYVRKAKHDKKALDDDQAGPGPEPH